MKPRVVDKPWGREVWWALTDAYVGKLIEIDAGKRLSLQKHEVKDESIFVVTGHLRLHLENDNGEIEVMELLPGQSRHVPTGKIHRFEAVTATQLIEVSTPEVDDVIRLEDDYGRQDV